jgi:replicative DNA helicase
MTETRDRAVPYDLAAERDLLAACLSEPVQLLEVLPIVKPQDFYQDTNRWIYEAMIALHEKRAQIDVVPLLSEIRRRGKLDQAQAQELVRGLYAGTLGVILNVLTNARAVADASVKRQLIKVGGRIAGMGYQDDLDSGALVEQAQELLGRLALGGTETTVTLQSQLWERLEHIAALKSNKNALAGVPTGFLLLDRLTGGYQAGDLIVVGALTSGGKTSFALDAAYAAAFGATQVLIYSAEMTVGQLTDRALSTQSGVDLWRVRSGEVEDSELTALSNAAGEIHSRMAAVHIDPTRDLPIGELCNRARALAHQHKIGLVVVDYLQLLQGTRERGDTRATEVGSISRGLKKLAGDVGAPVMVLSQLNRQIYARPDKRPNASDLYESGKIAQDADLVMFIHREAMFDKAAPEDEALLIVDKNRHGPTGDVPLVWRAATTTFEEPQAAEMRRAA